MKMNQQNADEVVFILFRSRLLLCSYNICIILIYMELLFVKSIVSKSVVMYYARQFSFYTFVDL